MESGKIQLQELFRFEPTGRNEHGRIEGRFTGCDTIPHFYEELRDAGQAQDITMFNRLSSGMHKETPPMAGNVT